VLIRVRRAIEEATSTAEAAFRREWAALESERQRLGDWHTHLEGRTKAEASHAARVQSELKADQESYRANLRKVFDREVTVASREKALAQREASFAKEEASLAAQRSEFKSRCPGLEVHKLELDKLSGSLHQWCQELQEAASKQTAAEMELEEDRKSLARRESLTTNMELQLERQRYALKSLKESAAKTKAELEERTREVEAAKAALDTREVEVEERTREVQEAVQEAVRKLQEDQRQGAQWIVDWASEASLALVPLGMSLIQVVRPPASIADALPVLNSASDRLRRLEPILAGQLEA
jgi:chromosome segregation ATPase